MATIGDVLAHLVTTAPNLSDDNRAEFLAAVAEAYPAQQPAAAADLSQAEADVAAAEAELAAAKAAPVG